MQIKLIAFDSGNKHQSLENEAKKKEKIIDGVSGISVKENSTTLKSTFDFATFMDVQSE